MSLNRRRILALANEPSHSSRLAALLSSAGADVDIFAELPAGNEPMPHLYWFIWLSSPDPAAIAILRPRMRTRTHVVVIVDEAKLEQFTDLLAFDQVNHIIVGTEIDRGVVVTAKKFLSGDIFGLEKLVPANMPINYVRLNDFAGRSKAIDAVTSFAAAQGIRKKVCGSIGQVCEELLMNALYDAPVDASGKQMFAEVDPHDRTRSRSPKPVSIRYAATDKEFLVAVRDRFGRLAKNTIVSYISKCLHSPTQIDRKTYGAGLGLYLVTNAASSYLVNVAFGLATEVICSFDRGAKTPLRWVGMSVHPEQAEQLRHGPTAQSANASEPELADSHPSEVE